MLPHTEQLLPHKKIYKLFRLVHDWDVIKQNYEKNLIHLTVEC